MPNQPRFQDAERVDTADLHALAGLPLAFSQQLGANLLTDPQAAASARPLVLSGFRPMVNGAASAKQMRVDRGAALLAVKDKGVVSYGTLTTEGPSQIITDMTAAAVGTHGVWVRAELVDGETASRVFWDPAVPKEFNQSIATRRVQQWGVTTQQYVAPAAPGAPGPEWTYVGDVEVRGAPFNDIVVTPKRKLYFEGDENGSTYTLPWGSGNDRNVDRHTYGIRDVRTAVQACLKKIEEMQSSTARWWTTTVEPLDKKISRFGDATPEGNYVFGGVANTFTVNSELNSTKQAIFTGSAPQTIAKSTTQAIHSLRNTANAAEKLDLIYNVAGTNFAMFASDASILIAPGGASELNAPLAVTWNGASGGVIPSVDNTVSLGLSTNKWSNIHGVNARLSGLLTMDASAEVVGNLIPNVGGVQDLGSTTDVWGTVYAGTIRTNTLTAATNLLISTPGGTCTLDGDVIVGAALTAGATVFAEGINVVDGAATVGGIIKATTLRATNAMGLTSGTFTVQVENGNVPFLALQSVESNGDDDPYIWFAMTPSGTNTQLTGGAAAGATYAKVKVRVNGVDKFMYCYDS